MRGTSITAVLGMAVLGAPLLAQAEPIKIASVTPYHDETVIPENIVKECTDLGTKLSSFTKEFGEDDGLTIVQEPSVDPKAGGKVLVIEITGAVSGGNAFIGHRKSMTAKAELFENGASRGSKVFSRDSGGGFMGGYKGSCSVLGRCAKALGKDIAAWVKDQP